MIRVILLPLALVGKCVVLQRTRAEVLTPRARRRSAAGLSLLLVLGLVACSTPEERYLTKEQDTEFGEKCGQGCAVVPTPLFMEILRRLKAAEGLLS